MMEDAEHYRFHGENRHSWEEAVVEWARSASIKPSTVKRYLVSIGQLHHLDGLYVDEITTKTIIKIAHRPGITNATRRRDLTAVSVVIRFCVGRGWRDDNPAVTYDRRVISERREPIALPHEWEINAAVAEAPGDFAKLIRWAQYTGMRQEECGALERLQVSAARKAADLSKTKTNRPRSVPLDDRALGTFAGTVQHLKSPYVFWHGTGSRYLNISSRFCVITARAVAKAKKAGKPVPRRFRFHDLRHWFAVDYLRRGGGIYDLQKVLGHDSIKTTEIYLDFLTPDEQEASKRSAQKPA